MKRVWARCPSDQLHIFKLDQTNCALNLRGIRTDITLPSLPLYERLCRNVPVKMAQIINQPWTDSKVTGDSNPQNSTSDNKNNNAHNDESSQSGQWEKDVEDDELHHERVDREIYGDCSAGKGVVVFLKFGGWFGLEVVDVLYGFFFQILLLFGRSRFLFRRINCERHQMIIQDNLLVFNWQNVNVF